MTLDAALEHEPVHGPEPHPTHWYKQKTPAPATA
jgi:hypothetical protein